MKLADFDVRTATLDRALREKAARNGDKVFLTNMPDGRTFSYAKLDELTRRAGNALHSAGVSAGAHVGVLMENCPEQLIAMWGIARSGRVTVPVNTAAKGHLLRHFLTLGDCVALVVERAFLSRVAEISADLPQLRLIYIADVDRPDGTGPVDADSDRVSVPVNWTVRPYSELLDGTNDPLVTTPNFTDTALLMFTSGTTGPSKANIYTHAHLLYYGTNVGEHHEYVPEDISYVYLPLFHINAFLGSTMGCFMADASIALATRFSIRRFWKDVVKSQATIFNCLSSIVNFLWNAPPCPEERMHMLSRIHLGPVPSFAREFEKRFGILIFTAYALTDFGMVCYYNSRTRRDKLGSAGIPCLEVELRVVDENDVDVPRGTPGEIILRHQKPWCSTLGYYKAPEATLASRRNLWFHTGDQGILDEDGYIWFKDRLKDALRRRGENISSFEVEEAIRSHPAVEDVAVYPVKAESSEDEVAVAVILKPSVTLSEEELIRYCEKNLAYFMVPRYVEFLEDFPRTMTHKVEKHKLRASTEARIATMWDRDKEGILVTRDGVSVRSTATET